VPRENSEVLGYYKLSTEVKIPKFATEGAAAFDVHLFLDGSSVLTYNNFNNQIMSEVSPDGKLFLEPFWRYKLPTGLIFDIPKGYKLNVNIRGGTALKKGLCLANSTGIIDWDYTDELFIVTINTSKTPVLVENGERIAQVRFEKVEPSELVEYQSPPLQKTNRVGGFNSTGIK
jgi:dUTP pyrophosphatase